MPDVFIMTDSNSGVTQEQAAGLGIEVIAMPFLVNDRQYFEGVDLSQEQFFEFLKEDAEVSTSQPAPGAILEAWEKALKEHEEIVYMPMTSGLSSSCATATALAEEFGGKVQVVDNKRVSVPLYQDILNAVHLKEKGLNAAEIRAELERMHDAFSIYITVDSLKYLKKGGRISGTTAVLGTMLNVKPVLSLGCEKLSVETKCRGMKAARRAMIEAMRKDLEGRLKEYYDQDRLRIMTAYSNVSPEMVEEWNREVREAFQVDYVESAPLTLSIACHVGPGALGIGAAYIAE